MFSSNLAVMNIDYDSDKKPFGPDLMVSYHGSEHYNSIRDNKRGSKPPPPPQRTYVKAESLESEYPEDDTTEAMTESNPPSSIGTSEASDKSEEATGQPEDEKVEASKSIPKKAPKGTAPCPCGSTLKYKKCCKDKDRRETRLQRVLQQRRGQASDDENEDEDAPPA